MFHDRTDAAGQLAQKLKGRTFRNPLVLAIPRGGVVTGAVLARELGADLDVVLARKLRAPFQPELAIGALSEQGEIYLNHRADEALGVTEEYLAEERKRQLGEIARRKELFRQAKPQEPIAGRTVIVTDDGIATGSTMIAALQMARSQNPYETIVAVPVASPDRLVAVRQWCDEIVCLLTPRSFWAIGQFYEDFSQVEDEQVVEILRQCAAATAAKPAAT